MSCSNSFSKYSFTVGADDVVDEVVGDQDGGQPERYTEPFECVGNEPGYPGASFRAGGIQRLQKGYEKGDIDALHKRHHHAEAEDQHQGPKFPVLFYVQLPEIPVHRVTW